MGKDNAFSEEEKQFVIDNIELGSGEIASRLNRNKSAIYSLVWKLRKDGLIPERKSAQESAPAHTCPPHDRLCGDYDILKRWPDFYATRERPEAHIELQVCKYCMDVKAVEVYKPNELSAGLTQVLNDHRAKELALAAAATSSLNGNGHSAGGATKSRPIIYVGEPGPELFLPNTTGRIVPNTSFLTSVPTVSPKVAELKAALENEPEPEIAYCNVCGDPLDFTFAQGYIPHNHDTGDDQPQQAVSAPTTPLVDAWAAGDIEEGDEGELVEVPEGAGSTPESLLSIAHQELVTEKGRIVLLRQALAIADDARKEAQREIEMLQNEVRILTRGLERYKAYVRCYEIRDSIAILDAERATLEAEYGL